MSLEDMRPRLENVKKEQQQEVYGRTYTLHTFTSDVHWESLREVLSGTLSFETLQRIPQVDGTAIFYPIGRIAMFSLFDEEGLTYLTIFAKRSISENSANKINYVLTEGEDEPSQIVFNRRIPSTAIDQFLTNHSHTKKMGGWRDLDLVGINTSSLHGSDIDRFSGTQQYDLHGRKKYIMIDLHTIRKTIRISEQGIVTFYGNITKQDILSFIRREIIPLL